MPGCGSPPPVAERTRQYFSIAPRAHRRRATLGGAPSDASMMWPWNWRSRGSNCGVAEQPRLGVHRPAQVVGDPPRICARGRSAPLRHLDRANRAVSGARHFVARSALSKAVGEAEVWPTKMTGRAVRKVIREVATVPPRHRSRSVSSPTAVIGYRFRDRPALGTSRRSRWWPSFATSSGGGGRELFEETAADLVVGERRDEVRSTPISAAGWSVVAPPRLPRGRGSRSRACSFAALPGCTMTAGLPGGGRAAGRCSAARYQPRFRAIFPRAAAVEHERVDSLRERANSPSTSDTGGETRVGLVWAGGSRRASESSPCST